MIIDIDECINGIQDKEISMAICAEAAEYESEMKKVLDESHVQIKILKAEMVNEKSGEDLYERGEHYYTQFLTKIIVWLIQKITTLIMKFSQAIKKIFSKKNSEYFKTIPKDFLDKTDMKMKIYTFTNLDNDNIPSQKSPFRRLDAYTMINKVYDAKDVDKMREIANEMIKGLEGFTSSENMDGIRGDFLGLNHSVSAEDMKSETFKVFHNGKLNPEDTDITYKIFADAGKNISADSYKKYCEKFKKDMETNYSIEYGTLVKSTNVNRYSASVTANSKKVSGNAEKENSVRETKKIMSDVFDVISNVMNAVYVAHQQVFAMKLMFICNYEAQNNNIVSAVAAQYADYKDTESAAKTKPVNDEPKEKGSSSTVNGKTPLLTMA